MPSSRNMPSGTNRGYERYITDHPPAVTPPPSRKAASRHRDTTKYYESTKADRRHETSRTVKSRYDDEPTPYPSSRGHETSSKHRSSRRDDVNPGYGRELARIGSRAVDRYNPPSPQPYYRGEQRRRDSYEDSDDEQQGHDSRRGGGSLTDKLEGYGMALFAGAKIAKKTMDAYERDGLVAAGATYKRSVEQGKRWMDERFPDGF